MNGRRCLPYPVGFILAYSKHSASSGQEFAYAGFVIPEGFYRVSRVHYILDFR